MVEIGVVLTPQIGGTWEGCLKMARRAEEGGLDSVWVCDHLLGWPPGEPILEAWTLMSALAAQTRRVGIGVLVLCQSFRPPGLLAKMASTLDLLSDGRLRLLLGAGWYRDEYEAFGFEFPPAGKRVAQTEEYLDICSGMMKSGADPFTYEGAHYTVREARCSPVPRRKLPLGIGARGQRMIDLAARKADEWNCPAAALPGIERTSDRVDRALAQTGRTVRRSLQVAFHRGGDTPEWLERFNARLGLTGSEDRIRERAIELQERHSFDAFYCVTGDEAGFDALIEMAPSLRR